MSEAAALRLLRPLRVDSRGGRGRIAGKLVVLERHRIETADTAILDFKQPYYAAEWLGVETTEALIRKYRDSSTLLIRSNLSDER